MTDDFKAVGTLKAKALPLGAFKGNDKAAKKLDEFEDFRVESIGYDENGHRVWEVQVRERT